MDCVKPLLESHPIELVNGLPVLTRDLQWSEELPAFVMGAYAMLEVGCLCSNIRDLYLTSRFHYSSVPTRSTSLALVTAPSE